MNNRKCIERLREHMTDTMFNRPSTALLRLKKQLNLKQDFENLKVIVPKLDYYTSRIKESMSILNKGNCAWNHPSSYDISYLVEYFENIQQHHWHVPIFLYASSE